MATSQQIAQQMAAYGNLDPARNHQTNNKSDWEKILAQMAMSQKMDSGTMAGFALGKLLRGGFDSWKENYDARGEVNDWLGSLSPDELKAKIADVEKNNPRQAEYMQKHLDKRLAAQEQSPQINSDAIHENSQRYLTNLFGDGFNSPNYENDDAWNKWLNFFGSRG